MTDHAALALAWDAAPVAAAVVHGSAHTLAYLNAAFTQLGAASGAVPHGTAVSAIVGRPVASMFDPLATAAVVAVLDAARDGGEPVRGWISAGPVGQDAWECMSWPLGEWADAGVAAGSSDGADRPLVLLIEASSHAMLVQARHRALTELMLLSALREETRADAADAARVTAENAQAAHGRFLAEMSHELRTPLQAVGGYAELVAMGLRGPVNDAQRDALARVQMGVSHLVELTSALLEQAKLEAGRVTYTLTTTPALEVVSAAVSLVGPQANARGLVLVIAPGDAEIAVLADVGKTRQVLLNLLANAVKFTAAGGTVTVRWRAPAAPLPDGVRQVVIDVTDTGCGIAPADLTVVFDAFVQVGRRLGGRDAGVGLGLAISRDLARGMGGDLTAESTLGTGSTFTLTLPLAS